MEKIKSYLGLAINAGYVIVGSDNLDGYDKKLYLVLVDKTAGKTSQKVANRQKERGVEIIFVDDLQSLSSIKNCKILGIKNKGISDQIIKIIKEN